MSTLWEGDYPVKMVLKSENDRGLCALTEEEVCALENYAYTWSPNAAA